ncbi:D-aminoacyl-tRNA deacylase [Catenisphaera adipataccumulans]|jgi:D-tyrosyl-tRNA(Tyr) deacylase|uniref:D-aminoacyl-tRNA deacylase n=1 Tax=Catenisphaera adipataccumulans TaxID=700500 RepID=A0A7W8FTX8_9FIRM|nr:D-aminoacyl-tRNA deacylase [Catenisphaera adipataccumulans]MBB5182019.1 D-tyrosyl-tRNA(Tyr) deacylase [Catenisphaera adipataccumulans]
MKVVVQRCKYAKCTIDGRVTGQIDQGYCLFVGFTQSDTPEVVTKMVRKIAKLRIFNDENGKMNVSIQDVHGSVLSISQFTLYADAKKGNRPSFVKAAKPDQAIPLYEQFNEAFKTYDIPVETGVFGADMKIELYNDGPVTIILDSEEVQ